MKSTQIMDLVSSYDAYCGVQEISSRTATEAPATTAYCGAVAISWISGMFVSQTVKTGC